MGPPDNPELYECWNCLVSRRQSMLTASLNKTSNQLDITKDLLESVDEMIEQIQRSIPDNFQRSD